MADITTKDAIKAKLGLTDNTNDAIIDGIINGAIGHIRNIVTRGLDAQDSHTEYFDEGPVYLNHTPIISITTIKYWDGTQYVTENDATKWRLISTGKVAYAFVEGLDALEVTYVGGGQDDVLRELIERMVIRQYRKTRHEGEKGTSFKDSTTTWHEVLQESDWAILDNYRVCL